MQILQAVTPARRADRFLGAETLQSGPCRFAVLPHSSKGSQEGLIQCADNPRLRAGMFVPDQENDVGVTCNQFELVRPFLALAAYPGQDGIQVMLGKANPRGQRKQGGSNPGSRYILDTVQVEESDAPGTNIAQRGT